MKNGKRQKRELGSGNYRRDRISKKYLVGKKKLYVSYAEGARLYSMNYYTFVKLAKAAGANIRIKKNVVIDLAKVDAFMESAEEGDGGIEDV